MFKDYKGLKVLREFKDYKDFKVCKVVRVFKVYRESQGIKAGYNTTLILIQGRPVLFPEKLDIIMQLLVV